MQGERKPRRPRPMSSALTPAQPEPRGGERDAVRRDLEAASPGTPPDWPETVTCRETRSSKREFIPPADPLPHWGQRPPGGGNAAGTGLGSARGKQGASGEGREALRLMRGNYRTDGQARANRGDPQHFPLRPRQGQSALSPHAYPTLNAGTLV